MSEVFSCLVYLWKQFLLLPVLVRKTLFASWLWAGWSCDLPHTLVSYWVVEPTSLLFSTSWKLQTQSQRAQTKRVRSCRYRTMFVKDVAFSQSLCRPLKTRRADVFHGDRFTKHESESFVYVVTCLQSDSLKLIPPDFHRFLIIPCIRRGEGLMLYFKQTGMLMIHWLIHCCYEFNQLRKYYLMM